MAATEIDVASAHLNMGGAYFEVVGFLYFTYNSNNNSNIYNGKVEVTTISTPSNSVTVKARSSIIANTTENGVTSDSNFDGSWSTNVYSSYNQYATTYSPAVLISKNNCTINYVRGVSEVYNDNNLSQSTSVVTYAPSYYLQDISEQLLLLSVDFLPGIDF